MQILLSALLALASDTSPDIAQALTESAHRAEIEAYENQAALVAAYQKLTLARLVAEGHVTIIRRVGKFIVISTIPADKNTRGGRAHAVYDPAEARIVYILGED